MRALRGCARARLAAAGARAETGVEDETPGDGGAYAGVGADVIPNSLMGCKQCARKGGGQEPVRGPVPSCPRAARTSQGYTHVHGDSCLCDIPQQAHVEPKRDTDRERGGVVVLCSGQGEKGWGR